MSYIQQSLIDNESINGLFKQHWLAWMPVVGYSILTMPFVGWFVWAITMPTVSQTPLLKAVSGAAAMWLLYKAAKRAIYLLTLEQAVTSLRTIKKQGWIARQTDELKLDAIETIEIKQTVLQRIFKMGDVFLSGRGGDRSLVFTGIDDPVNVKRQIEMALHQ